jgi:LuxR family maltose regulon positive regulatory protein
VTEPLLITKLRVPSLRPGAVPRPRLLERLDQALCGPLTLLSAPPGYGKTTLLAAWVARGRMPVAWLSLEAADADPVRLVGYLAAAVGTVVPGPGESMEQVLQAGRAAEPERWLTFLVNDLADDGTEFALVLDDYHSVSSPEADRVLGFLAEHLPGRVHLAVATRSDPPIPLARLRVQGRLSELRAADLRFSSAETGQFLSRTMGLSVPDEVVAALADRTEGWPAGLQMAALSLRSRTDQRRFVAEFVGSHRDLLAYLAEEVLERQPREIQDFLARTSILEGLTGSLCEAVTGRPAGADTLEALERGNLFIEALGDDGHWYRYHGLFGDLLRSRLRRRNPGLETDLHRRASLWHEEHGNSDGAIRHALGAGDHERAARLAEAAGEQALMDGRISAFRGWLDALPEDAIRARPLLCAFDAIALFYATCPIERVERRLVDAETAGLPLAAGVAAALRALIASVRDETSRVPALAEQALHLLPPDRPFLRSLAGTTSGLAALADGDLRAAGDAFEMAERAASSAGSILLRTLATRRLGEIQMSAGDLRGASRLFEKILDFTSGGEGRRLPLASVGLCGRAEVLREWNRLGEAAAGFHEGIPLARGLGPVFTIGGLVGWARVAQAQGDLEAASGALEEAASCAAAFDATQSDDRYVEATRVRLWLAQGELSAAARWADAQLSDARPEVPRFYPAEVEQTVLAQVQLALGRPAAALLVLDPLRERAEAQGRRGNLVRVETLRALALAAEGRGEEALEALRQALEAGEEGRFMRTFLDEGPALAGLLRRGLVMGALPEYGHSVLAGFAEDAGPVRRRGLVEPLSERERQVLRYLPGSLSVPEIARELYVAPSTVRSHLKAIYRKLGVSRRAEAVKRAGDLGLL